MICAWPRAVCQALTVALPVLFTHVDAKANLPAGFFDDAPADNADTEPSSASAGTDAKSNLPAGFFDDPGEQASGKHST